MEDVVSVTVAGEVLTLTATWEAVDTEAVRGRLHFIEGGRVEALLHGEGEKLLWLNDGRDCFRVTMDTAGDTFVARRVDTPD